MASFSFDGLKLTGEGRKYVAEMDKLLSKEIHVGFQAGRNAYEDGTDIVDVAAFNELGTSNIPARPFMKQSWENNEGKLKAACQRANKMISQGETAEEACKMLGVYGVGLIQREIRDGNFVPNAPSTIRRKGSSKPLIDTGRMRQSVHYVVKDVRRSPFRALIERFAR